ncbi:hypothetical protein [Deinococcus koreensis]|uniref:Lipoprotein n=1 Tax=Deinococcus koreensis TaxID=2054903 RepID=A0A2K3V135_9DEIO|nr:hypothetical protein [Deinococcus koreensis]PNY82495.1 hypothetical protein CVO96_15070 [Deinococcus koreensis]
MKAIRPRYALLAAALLLSGCNLLSLPRTVPLAVVGMALPATVAPSAPLVVTLRYSVGCGDSEEAVALASRTATRLVLSATARNRQSPGTACPAIYIERALEYTDSGTPARTDPFEVVVNGKAWGSVVVR